MKISGESSLRIAEIYPTFNGEQNAHGIGSPTLFIRLAGCHIRCYKSTKGILCDTPKFLSTSSGESMFIYDIIFKVREFRQETGINLICISGGDPLARRVDEIALLIGLLILDGFDITVETSGTISVKPLLDMLNKDDSVEVKKAHKVGQLSFILDCKTPSAGISVKCRVEEDADSLSEYDYIKFVVDDEKDYYFTTEKIDLLYLKTKATITVGAYWGGKLSPFDLFNRLKIDNLTGKIVMNFQVHKMAIASDFTIDTNSKQI